MRKKLLKTLRNNWKLLENDGEEYKSFLTDLESTEKYFFRREPAGWNNLIIGIGKNLIPYHRCSNPTDEWVNSIQDDEQSEILVCIGTGLGYQIPAITKYQNNFRRTVIAEVQAEALQVLLAQENVCDIIPEGVTLLYAPQPERLRQFLATLTNRYGPTNIKFVVLESVFPYLDNYFEVLLGLLQDEWVKGAVYLKTLEKQAGDITDNVLGNLELLEKGYALKPGSGRGQRAVVIGSGPSLDLNLPLLKTVADHAQIIAAGSALNTLLNEGIRPDFVVISDPQQINKLHFPEERYDLNAAVDLTVVPSLVSKFTKRKLICNVGHPIVQILTERIPVTKLECWGTVTSTALALCAVAGFDEIALVGTDFSFEMNETHAEGYMIPLRFENEEEVTDITGRKVKSSQNLINYADYVGSQVGMLEQNGIRVFNACERGILSAGEFTTLREFLWRLRTEGVEKKSWSWWKQIKLKRRSMQAVKNSLAKKLKHSLAALEDVVDQSISLNDFFDIPLAKAAEGAVMSEARVLERAIISRANGTTLREAGRELEKGISSFAKTITKRINAII